ncbi:PTS sugar transporter subunit IIA [Pelosinus sp. UFO1]|uniref:PTS sugar transporter subunit IIA n=1 Tax=Pelosinus sp. UFO1 TaxID=484770 RepID=UPI0004D10CDE|nr:PTS sugar transporter subunit IIA [Pelosinus sp. UFO1]AIF53492.1 PTS system fructose subfamily IIA component [Pelosinus sp. UFO1]
MKTVIVITGHGNYATGLKSSIELLAGQNGDLYYLDLMVNDTDQMLKEQMTNVVKKNKGSSVLFICDILGGTPFKVSVEIANNSDHMEVVAGCNIGSILEGVFQKDKISVRELADSMVSSSKRTTVRFETVNKNTVIDPEEGI